MVLKEYKKSNEPYLFPILSSKHKTEQQRLNRLHKVITKVNKALKIIGEELHIPIKLTTYVARHSYATVLKRAGVATSIICESLGHSSEKNHSNLLGWLWKQPNRQGYGKFVELSIRNSAFTNSFVILHSTSIIFNQTIKFSYFPMLGSKLP